MAATYRLTLIILVVKISPTWALLRFRTKTSRQVFVMALSVRRLPSLLARSKAKTLKTDTPPHYSD